jgi:hypothetical protein
MTARESRCPRAEACVAPRKRVQRPRRSAAMAGTRGMSAPAAPGTRQPRRPAPARSARSTTPWRGPDLVPSLVLNPYYEIEFMSSRVVFGTK